MEEYRDNGRGKVQTSYDRLSDEALLRQLRAGDAAICLKQSAITGKREKLRFSTSQNCASQDRFTVP